MDTAEVKVGATGVDVAAIVAEIRETVDRKAREGAYTDLRVAAAEKTNLDQLKDQDGFFALYLESLRDAVAVDINDFPIYERRRAFSPVLVLLKKTLWNMLKFYTYRLWSQQNQVNSMLLALAEEMDDKYRRKLEALETRIRDLEARRSAAP
jgi:hypothetical protein